MERLKLLIKNFIQAGSGNIVGQFLGFLVIAYLGRILGPKGYGIFNFAQAYLFYFYFLTDLGLSLYCVKQANQLRENTNVFQVVFSLRFYLSILATLLFIITIIFMNKTPNEKNVLYLMGISIFFTGIFLDSFFTAKNNMKYIGLAQFLKNGIFYLLCVLLIHGNSDITQAGIAFSVGILLSTFYLLFRYKSIYPTNLLIKPNKDFYQFLKAAFPLGFSLLMIQINSNFDIIYLSFLKDQKIVGYYSAAYRIINFLIAILVIYFNASYGTIAELIKKDKEELNQFILNFFRIGILFVAPITVGGITLSKPLMVFVYGEKFQYSGMLFSLLMPLIIIRMVTSTYTAVLIMGDKSKQLSIAVTIGAVINIILNIILVPKFNAIGSAFATILCETLQGIILYQYYKRVCSVGLIVNTLQPILFSLIMAFTIISVHQNLFISLIIGVLIYFFLYSVTNYKFVLVMIKKYVQL